MTIRTLELRRAVIRARVIRLSIALLAMAGGVLAFASHRETVPGAAPGLLEWSGPAPAEEAAADVAISATVPTAPAAPPPRPALPDRPRPAAPVAMAPEAGAARPDIMASDGAEMVARDEGRAAGRRIVLTSIEATQARACTPEVRHLPLAPATLALEISAPCDAGARLTLRHGPLELDLRLDGQGHADVDLPAMAARAEVSVEVEGRAPVTVGAALADFDRYHRVALTWTADMSPELHAYEGPAVAAVPGHVGPHAPRNLAYALSGTGGFLVSLGDPDLPAARMAQVYTLPKAHSASLGLEVPVTAGNCGETLVGGLLRPGAGGALRRDAMEIPMPGCGTIGDLLILPDVLTLDAAPGRDAG